MPIINDLYFYIIIAPMQPKKTSSCVHFIKVCWYQKVGNKDMLLFTLFYLITASEQSESTSKSVH